MNPYSVLNIDPTTDKKIIRRAFIAKTKEYHPDLGGTSEEFQIVQAAYEMLRTNSYVPKVLNTEIKLSHAKMLNGCIATVVIGNNPKTSEIIEVKIPKYTFPGNIIKFYDKESTFDIIYVKVIESKTDEYKRLDSSIIFQRQLNKRQAIEGCNIEILNFDDSTHTVLVPPNTTADTLIYKIPNFGFYDRGKQDRGNLTIIIDIE